MIDLIGKKKRKEKNANSGTQLYIRKHSLSIPKYSVGMAKLERSDKVYSNIFISIRNRSQCNMTRFRRWCDIFQSH